MYDPEDYEFYDDWCTRDDDERDIGLEEYNEMRCIESYGFRDYDGNDDE